MGHNVLAIAAAAIAIWAIGFLIYVVLFQQQWMGWMGMTEEQVEQDNGRMPLMVVMPFLQATGLSLAVKWRNQPGWMGGLTTGRSDGGFLQHRRAHVRLGVFLRGERVVRPGQPAFPSHACRCRGDPGRLEVKASGEAAGGKGLLPYRRIGLLPYGHAHPLHQ
jgi:hypothetical protein